ncbi:hypothetical protein XM38_044990 [Halomicronema hongdechloris C2206]|uniref:Addiction module component n=1 Tax=Halomicronema hongdechloris C2206 TaxID=1641165 RepID=A0A1Z3HTE7_9CYAN|nr:addiction module protein [Halomicronema hongdechloris]ASC73532.1 hypothetical protein XM38_044990 [Halomicronema hongdechloris C2206]
MDITTTLNEITALSVEEWMRLVQAIWDSTAAQQAYPDLTEAQKQELDRRGGTMRLISAREVTRFERGAYEKGLR